MFKGPQFQALLAWVSFPSIWAAVTVPRGVQELGFALAGVFIMWLCGAFNNLPPVR